MPIHLEFQLLQQFVALARVKNFTRAAEELHLSQSALSRAIRKLEDQLGQPLFERKPREVVLTDLGRVLLERAKQILKLVDDTFSELSESARPGRIRLGAIPTIAPYFLPRLLAGFNQKHPEISVIVQEDTTDMLVRACSHGDIDLALVALPITNKSLEVESLFSEELLLVLPAGHTLASEDVVGIQAIQGYPFVMLNEAHCLSENISSFCRRKSVQLLTVERTSQLTTVQELVALNHGVSIVPEMARKIDLSEERVYRSIGGETPMRTVAMIWSSDRYQSVAIQAMLKHLRHQGSLIPNSAIGSGRSAAPIAVPRLRSSCPVSF